MSTLGGRMKAYEAPWKPILPPRMPIIIRVDGRAFHTLTSVCEKPFDPRIVKSMDDVALALCQSVAGATMAYVQSDEVSVLVHPYKRLESQTWFGADVIKMASISACIAANAFNASYTSGCGEFDSRVFVLPEADVCNYFLWRQQDAERNSINGCAQARMSHKQLQGINTRDLQDILLREHDFNWNDVPTSLKRGRCARKREFVHVNEDGTDCLRTEWFIDNETPRFGQDRAYVEALLATEKE